jgi:CHAT domain/SIR2-like domain
MAEIFYENFDLVVTPTGNKTYKVQAYGGASGGESAAQFSLEKAPEEVLNAIDRRNLAVVNRAVELNLPAENGSQQQTTGRYLFQTIFETGKLLAQFQVTLVRAMSRNARLRLRLNLTDAPELVGLPWEQMLTGEGNALALDIRTSVVRYQNVAFPQDDVVIRDKPVRMLVVISNPAAGGLAALDVEKEYAGLELALKPLRDQGLLQIDRLPHANLKELDDWLFKNPTHIFHFIGHGVFDKDSNKGQLVFEKVPGDSGAEPFERVDGERLAQSLRNGESLKLAMLNACEGAVVADTDSYAGVAQQLLQTGNIPIVIAMRKKVSDDVAIVFAQTFYQWLLVNNLPVDAAMTRARLSMQDKEKSRNPTGRPTEWGTPVLFMRHHNGYLVDFHDFTVRVPTALPEEIDPAIAKHYQTVLNALTQGKLVVFLGLDVNLYGRDPIEDWKPGGPLPGYAELVDYLVSVSKHPYPFKPALADVSQYAYLFYTREETLGAGTFYSDLSTIFNGASSPTRLHEFWAQVAANNEKLTAPLRTTVDEVRRRFLIVSSTYDNLLEKAFKNTLDRFHVVSYIAHGDYKGRFRHIRYVRTRPDGEAMPQAPQIVEPANGYPALYDSDPVILKLPGTVGEGMGLRFAITEDQYLDFFTKRELAGILPSQLLDKLRYSNHLFLGCNVREWTLRALLYRIWEDSKTSDACWTVQDHMTPVQKEYWEACNVRIIERPLTLYVDELELSFQTLLSGVK